ncbi:MAG: transposase [Burkholderiales bacterium]|nr:transposase [Burkholderiales bacterium]
MPSPSVTAGGNCDSVEHGAIPGLRRQDHRPIRPGHEHPRHPRRPCARTVRHRDSPDLLSVITDSVIGEVSAWQARPPEPCYAFVFFDALRVTCPTGLVQERILARAGVRALRWRMPVAALCARSRPARPRTMPA